jgi:hypothetical protein
MERHRAADGDLNTRGHFRGWTIFSRDRAMGRVKEKIYQKIGRASVRVFIHPPE